MASLEPNPLKFNNSFTRPERSFALKTMCDRTEETYLNWVQSFLSFTARQTSIDLEAVTHSAITRMCSIAE